MSVIVKFLIWAPWVTIFYLILIIFANMEFNFLWLFVAVVLDIIGYASS